MATSSVCTTCLRALRQQTRRELQQTSLSPTRTQSQRMTARPLSTSTPSRLQVEPKATQNRPPPPPPRASAPESTKTPSVASIAANARNIAALRTTTEPYVAYGSTEDLFKACSAQCGYTIPAVQQTPPAPPPKNAAQEDVGQPSVANSLWYSPRATGGLELDVTFNTWAQVVMLHMYCVTARLRCFPAEYVKVWHQNLLDHFFFAAEDRMAVWHNMSARSVRNKYLKDLWLQWRGLLLSYDEGLIKGDAVLATAVWRNVFKARDEADLASVALVTAYMRRQLKMLDQLEDGQVSSGEIKFESMEQVKAVLGKESPWMHKSFTAEEMKGLDGAKA